VEKRRGHEWRRFLRRIFTTAPSGVELTPSTTAPSAAVMRLQAMVVRLKFLFFRLFDRFGNDENCVRAN
jgi:hypothetical protein